MSATEPCIFCEIVARKAPAQYVANTGSAIAIVPLLPVTPGHIIFISKAHVRDAFSNPAITAAVMQEACRFAFTGNANIITSIGEAATQTVFHLHIHIVPRRPDDGLKLPWSP